MAKIKFGMIVTDGRGKLGGQVFSKNRAGSYIRTKVTPVNPTTVAQTRARSLFGAISQQWSGLSSAARLGWNEAVSEWQKTDIFGDLKLPSGKALFQRLNNQAQSAGYPAVTTAPDKLEMVLGVVAFIAMSNVAGDLAIGGEYNGTDARIMAYATPPLSPGTTFVKNKLRNIYNVQSDSWVEQEAYQAYINKFGSTLAGANVYVGIKYVLPNGQSSPMQILKVDVID